MELLAFGTYDVDAHPRFGVLLEGLRDHGDHVVEVDVPLGIDTAARVAMLRQPWRLPRLALRLLRCWATLTVRGRRAYRRHRPDAVLVGYLGHFDVVLARLLFPRALIVLDHLVFAADTAADRGVVASRRTRLLTILDRRALRSADVVLLDTEEQVALVPDDLLDRVVVVAVGAPAGWFDAGAVRPARPDGGPLTVVFYGLFTPLQGAPVIGSALAELAGDPGIAVTLIGRGQDLEETRRLAAPNPAATWLDWVAGDRLPALVAAHDVCLGIFGDGAKGRRVVPNKVYQGAAAGCAIVTSDTEPQRAALDGAAVLVPPGDPAALAAALRELAADPLRVESLRSAARDRATRLYAPAAVVTPLRARLERHLTGRLTGPATGRVTRHPNQPPHQESRPMTTAPPNPAPPREPSAALPPLPPRAWLRYDLVRRMFDRLRPATVLEVGCGQGSMGARLARRPGLAFTAVEPDPASYAVAAPRITGSGGTVLCADHTGVPAGTTYDLVCAFEVLEHLEDDTTALREWAELVRPGGHLMLSVPAFANRFGPLDTVAGHFRRYDPDLLRDLLEGAGLEDPDIVVYGWPLGYALEVVRNRMDARRLAQEQGETSIEERTAASGRHQQPGRAAVGPVMAVATWPFRQLQRVRPDRGTGLVAVARRPG